MKSFLSRRPYWGSVAVFAATMALPVPFVIFFKALGLGMEPLRMIIPAAESIFIVGLIYHLGWLRQAGFFGEVRDIWVLWLPAALACAPVALFGTIQIPAHNIALYLFALILTGVHEEGFARAFLMKVLYPHGIWPAVLFSSALFSLSHLSNLFFAQMGVLEMFTKFFLTFSFGLMYCALFLRTLNIWPLIVIHAAWDFSFLVSGTEGPYVVTPFPASLHMAIGLASCAYAVQILRSLDHDGTLKRLEG